MSYLRHTGIVVYGLEYFFGGMGIEFCNPVIWPCLVAAVENVPFMLYLFRAAR